MAYKTAQFVTVRICPYIVTFFFNKIFKTLISSSLLYSYKCVPVIRCYCGNLGSHTMYCIVQITSATAAAAAALAHWCSHAAVYLCKATAQRARPL